MIDPYIFGGAIIAIVFAMGAILVKHIYDGRTHTPSINAESMLNKIIPKP